MTVYIAGPISDDPLYVKKFEARSKALRGMGYEVVSPVVIAEEVRLSLDREPTYNDYIKAGLKELLRCDGISMLPEWRKSKGARLEHRVAELSGLTFVEYHEITKEDYENDD